MVIFATIVKPDWIREARRHARVVIAYGLVPIAGAQLCYYYAVSHLSVGVALLLEYTAPILVVGWIWATTRRRPRGMTLAGVGLAIAGIVLVLDILSGASHVNAIGVTWGLAAAICAACYFMMSDEVTADGSGLSSITLSAGGLVVGAVAVGLLGVSGVMPLTFTDNDAVVAGLTVPWWLPVIMLGVVSTAIAYTLGISGVARLRPSFASLVGLELRPRKMREATVLWERLTEAAGIDARDAVWNHPDLLPRSEDLDEPAGFIDRVIGGDTSGLDIDAAIEEFQKQADDDTEPDGPVDS